MFNANVNGNAATRLRQDFMPIDPATGIWVPHLSPKQLAVYNCMSRYILSSGPRFSGKTRASLHRILRHAWEVDHARLAMFTKFKGTALSGVWPLLTGPIMKEWLAADICSDYGEFRYTIEPRELGAVRMQYFKIQNYWGGESEIQLHSLDYDKDVEKKMFSTEYSGFYFSELQHFQDKNVFYLTDDQLRMDGVPYDKYLWIADTNPPEESTDHFAYKIWFTLKNGNPPEDAPDDEKAEFLQFQRELALFEFTLDDAIFADPKQISKLKAKYRHDEEAWNRFVLGKWTKTRGHGDKHFSSVFRPKVHVIGDISSPDRSEWEVLCPDSHTHELFAGWDIGKVNHAMAIAQKRLNEEGLTRWEFLDELVVIAEKVKVEEFTAEAIVKRDALEKFIGHEVTWRDWTDTSAFDWAKGGTDEIDSEIVERVSMGRIRFVGATAAKRPGAVRKRVEKLRELLAANRLLVSAHCVHIIEMFQELRKGANELAFIARNQTQKHIFDAVSYVVYSEMLEDLEEDNSNEGVTGRRLVSIG